MRTLVCSTAFALGAALAPPAHAQFRSLGQDAGIVVPSPARLAQGDAWVAHPSRESALFGNPAHLPSLGGRLPRVTLGATVGAGGNVGEAYRFVQDDLRPAIEEGLDQIRQDDIDRLERLYNEALRIGAGPKTARGVLELSGTLALGDVGLGVGVATNAVARGQMFNGGAGIPYIDVYAQNDLLVPLAVGYRAAGERLGATGALGSLSAGAQATVVRRWLTAKAGPVDTFDPNGERLYGFGGTATLVDLGLHAADVGTPGLDLGLSVHNVFGTRVPLSYERSWVLAGSDATPEDADEIAELDARFAARGTGSSLRVGASYRLPLPPAPGVGDIRLLADYTTASTSELDQSAASGLRLGAQAAVGGVLDVRAGMSQGMPSAGVGVRVPGVRLDYATHGVEEGAFLGEQRRRVHLLQLRLGIP